MQVLLICIKNEIIRIEWWNKRYRGVDWWLDLFVQWTARCGFSHFALRRYGCKRVWEVIFITVVTTEQSCGFIPIHDILTESSERKCSSDVHADKQQKLETRLSDYNLLLNPYTDTPKALRRMTHKLNCLTRRFRRSTCGFSMVTLLEAESCEELGILGKKKHKNGEKGRNQE